jgi:beta-ketoacyl synthase-like protein
MSRIAIEGFRSLTSAEGLGDLDARLPAKNSLRRANDAGKAAVAAAAESLRAADLAVSDRVGVYVGQQQVSLEYCAQFVEASYRNGPRLASPMLFSESVANNAATHLSLTLGFTGALQTFIGSRAAGLQALAAAREDLEDGTIDAGLVVVLSFPHALTAEAYGRLYAPDRRKEKPPALPFLSGAAAFVVRHGKGGAELVHAGSACGGMGREDQVRTVRALVARSDVRSAIASTFRLAREGSLEILRAAGVSVVPSEELPGEAFALDPFLRLRGAPGAVAVLGEDGTAGLLTLGA